MSRTTRMRTIHSDRYDTPCWAIDRLFEVLPWLGGVGGNWLEPAVGSGNIVRVSRKYYANISWHMVENHKECLPDLEFVSCEKDKIFLMDFLDFHKNRINIGGFEHYDVCVFNPPFSIIDDFFDLCVKKRIADVVCMFQTLNFIGSKKRHPIFSSNPPYVYVIPDRVSHTSNGKTDAVYSAWFLWDFRRISRRTNDLGCGLYYVLKTTPTNKRKG